MTFLQNLKNSMNSNKLYVGMVGYYVYTNFSVQIICSVQNYLSSPSQKAHHLLKTDYWRTAVRYNQLRHRGSYTSIGAAAFFRASNFVCNFSYIIFCSDNGF